jgi:hypothetical protein
VDGAGPGGDVVTAVASLFQRELRRLAPFALAATLVAATALVASLLGRRWLGGAAVGFAPLTWLALGLAVAVPDTQSGGAAFLARLPVAGRRLTSLRLAALAACALPGLALVALTPAFGPAQRASHGLGLPDAVGLDLLALGAGALASSMARTTISAVLLGLVALLGGALAVTVALPLELVLESGGVAACLGLVWLVAAARTVHLGELHRESSRPVALGLAGVATSMALLVGGSVAVHVQLQDDPAAYDPAGRRTAREAGQ